MSDKWNTLIHQGPVWPPEYQYQKFAIFVNAKEYTLSPEAEELAFAWAQKANTEYVQDKLFQKNFWSDFKKLVPQEVKNSKFPTDWDFSSIVSFIERERELKKLRTKEQKKQEKDDKEKIKQKYGFAELDGQKIPLGAYMIEPPGLYMGRGDHPLRGRWKNRTQPEDVIINCSKSNIPEPPKGHTWKKVLENKNGLYTAYWIPELTDKPKHILFSNDSIVKQNADQHKFSKAIKLAANLDKIQNGIDKALSSKDKKTRMVATVSKLIADMAIRVGDEKGEDEADTVGASSLRVEHIKIDGLNVSFDFLGKDSVRYQNTVSFSEAMIKNLQEFSANKKSSDNLFPSIRSTDVNEFLGNIVPDCTAKVFRTAYGSKLLAEELRKESKLNPLQQFTEANLAVAHKLNHHSAVPKTHGEQLDKIKQQIKELKQELVQEKENYKARKSDAQFVYDQLIKRANKVYKGQQKKEAVRRAQEGFDNKVEKLDKKLNTLKTKIENLEQRLDTKKRTAGVALGTSKTNYSDSRIIVSFCKDKNLDIKKVYTPALLKKFEWAMNAEPDYYKKYPNVKE